MSANDELQAHTCEKMLEFYEKPQDYVKKSHNKQDLTEQWKKGELEQGYYYMQIPTGDIRIITECMKVDCKGFSILSKVPSYEEWQDTENRSLLTTEFSNEIDELNEENQQLKDVISKMCMELVDPDDDMSNGLAEYFNQDLLLEIHEVLK